MASKDLYRDTWVRYLGYSNEVGEAFRSVVDKKVVVASYYVASAYVVADTLSKSRKTWVSRQGQNRRALETFKTGIDVLMWQSLASVIIPGFIINRICYGTGLLLRRTACKKQSKWITVAVGLASIPIIIKPIDSAVDHFMDGLIRPILRKL